MDAQGSHADLHEMTRGAGLERGTRTLFDALSQVALAGEDRQLAIIDGNARLTYAELVYRATQFAAALISAGVQPGDRVGLILGNSKDFLIAAFAAWKCGTLLVPLNPQLQESELLKYSTDSNMRVLITTFRNASLAQALSAQGTSLEHTWLFLTEANRWTHIGPTSAACAEAESPGSAVGLDSPAIIQYSTGATGHPKRITRSHGQLLAEFLAVSQILQTGSADRILGAAPFFHSHGLMNAALLALLCGGTLYVLSSFFAADAAQLIDDEKISGFPGAPFMFQHLVGLREPYDLSSLRFAVSAGAPLALETADAFAAKYGVKVSQLYGSTETGVISLCGSHQGGNAACVGRPIPGVSVQIVDAADQPTPAGSLGKVRVASPFAARSYDNAVSNGESYFAGEYFFPGDIGRMTAHGELFLCGRDRRLIDIGGNKADPAEIEDVLLELSAVAEAVVFGIPDGTAGEMLKAVVVAQSSISHQEIRAHCEQRLARFKHPRVLEFRSELPKSPLGKVLRKYLMDEGSIEPTQLDPRSCFGIAFGEAAIAQSPQFSSLPPFLRVLLVTDGTVTRSMEAFFWEPVDVDVLAHSCIVSDRDYPDLNIVSGSLIIRRRVILRGRSTRSVYAFAESILASAQLSQDMRRKLIEERKGIGELLRDDRLETFREVINVRQARANDLAPHLEIDANSRVMIRSYRIYHDGRAAILVEEVFPECRF